MKKTILLLSATVIFSTTFQSCRKEEAPPAPVTTNINVSLKQNEAYTFTLPANKSKTPYKITSQASHFAISTVGKDASGNDIYQYTPEQNFMGNDVVTVADTEEHKECGHHHPHMGLRVHHHHGDDNDADDVAPNIVNITFAVGVSSASDKVNAGNAIGK